MSVTKPVGTLTLLMVLAFSGACWGGEPGSYEETFVPNGGSIIGTVTFAGSVPKPKAYNLTTLPDPIYCGRISDGKGWRLVQPFQVGSHGEFQGVLVRLEDVTRGKPFPPAEPVRIQAVDCQFLPFMNVVRDRQDVEVVNMDPAMHDIQAYETSQLGPRVLFNLPLPISPRYPNQAALSAHFHKHYEGVPMRQTVRMTKGRRVFTMQCGFHAFMESWALVPDNPYVALTDAAGRFRLDDVPPGTYTVAVWHPYLRDAYEQIVTVEPNGSTEVHVDVQAPTGRLYTNQMVEEAYTRYGITEDVQSQILPTVEKQSY